MTYSWYETVWPWVGLGGAIAILILLFFTDLLQSNKLLNKWKDSTWLAWLCTASYLIHNVEEYGIDITGKLFAFPETFSQIMVGSGQSVTGIFFMAINIPAFWFTYPLLSIYSRKHPWISPVLAAGLFCNAISHVIPIIVGIGYTPGTLTAIIIFFPVSIWSAIALFGKDKLSYKWLFSCIVIFLLGYIVLLGSSKLYIADKISYTVLVLLQVINGPLCFGLACLAHMIGEGKCDKLVARGRES